MRPFFATVLMLALLPLAASDALADARERLDEAKRLAREGANDFAFMQFQAALREDPDPGQAAEAAFAVGEYCSSQKNLSAAADAFERVVKDPKSGLPGVLALAHLSKLARSAGDEAAADAYDTRLKDLLSARKLLLVFEDHKTRKWTSPLGRRFQVTEYVDRLEVVRDGEPFYAVTLP